jgi:isopenicillin N synthase-like dioxygenase
MNAAERWIDVPPIEGTFVVNLGDLMARATNDIYISTLHRVLNRSTSARLSMAFFVSPNPNAMVSVLETCVSELRPARYPPVVSGDYLSALLAQAHRTGRSGVSSRTAERLKLR